MEDVKLGEPQVCPACKALNPAGLYLPFECLKCAETPKEKTDDGSKVPLQRHVMKPCPFCKTEPDPCLNGVNGAGKMFMLIHKANCFLKKVEWLKERDFDSWNERAL